MSKSIGNLTGTGTVKYDNSPVQNLIDYLKSQDTSHVDNTLSNMTTVADSLSQNLQNTLGNYTFNVDTGDAARQRMENAVYQSYVDKLTPQFNNQVNDLTTSLINKGLSVGSQAYQRAMNDLYARQNSALNEAAYQSVMDGQKAYSQSLNDQMSAGNYTAGMNQQYIALLQSLLNGSQSGYDNQMDIYSAASNAAANTYAAKQQAANNRLALTNSLIKAASTAAGWDSGNK